MSQVSVLTVCHTVGVLTIETETDTETDKQTIRPTESRIGQKNTTQKQE